MSVMNMKNIEVLKEKLDQSFKDIRSYLLQLDDNYQELSHLTHFERGETSIQEDFEIEHVQEGINGLRERIDHELFMIRVRLLSIFELVNNKSLVAIVNEVSRNDKIKNIEHYSYADIFVSPKLYKYESLFEVLIDMESSNEDLLKKYRLLDLERLLKSTGNILYNEGFIPKSENDIQKRMYNFIKSHYPSTLRESSLPKPTKNYRVDFAIKSLSTCIEFKYVTSEKEARKILGGIYEDIHAYAGYKDWTNFIAVIYMTNNFFTEFQLNEELKMSDIPDNWNFLLTYGHGTRKNSQIN